MALPKLNTPTYELVLPSSEEKIKFRPFLVKEEKILMIAMESNDNSQIIEAVKTIVSECTFNEVKVAEIPMFDVEYLFLNIRAKSVGEVSQIRLLCQDDGKTYANVEVDLTEVNVKVNQDHTNKIELTDDTGMLMKYPTIDSFKDSGLTTDVNPSNMLEIVASCISQIYEEKGEKVYEAKDQTTKELIEFLEQMNTKQFKDVQHFFENMPKLKHEVQFVNPKTKKKSKVMLQGLNDFFG